MNTKKHLLLSGITLLLFIFLSSCEKIEINTNVTEETNLTPEQLMQKKNLESIAQIVTNIADNLEISSEVFNAVNISLNAGLDEQYRFKDVLYPDKSRLSGLKSLYVNNLSKKFRTALEKYDRKSTKGNSLESFILYQ